MCCRPRYGAEPSHLILPVLTLSALYMAYIARLTRSGMLEVLRSNYIRTARAKGLSEWKVITRHALRGGLLPVVSFSGPALAFLLTGTVVVERIFALPGLGNYFINANLNRDEPLIIGIVAFISIAVLVFNLLVDIAYGFIDPRVRSLSVIRPWSPPEKPGTSRHIALEGRVEAPAAQPSRDLRHGDGVDRHRRIRRSVRRSSGTSPATRTTTSPADKTLIKSFPPFTAPDGSFSWTHPMGTDIAGRDILARVLLGGRISLMVGIISTLVSLIIGVAFGATAGYLGGKVDEVMMRIVDVLYAIPYMMIVIVLLAFFGGQSPLGQLFLLFVALGAVSWLTMARIVRGQVMSLKNQEFVLAARATGVSTQKIIARHLVPEHARAR